MSKFTINDSSCASLKDQIILITGGSSGIGLATAQHLSNLGALVVQGDINPPPSETPNVTFIKTDVSSWKDLVALFKKTRELHGRIDHVFANAGLSGVWSYIDDEFDGDGELKEPDHSAVDVMLKGMMNTVKLAIHHNKTRQADTSIVVTASASAFQRFPVPDYAAAKHATLGLMRSFSHLPIRINAIAPSWTATGLVQKAAMEALGIPVQSPHVAARSVAVLMAEKWRNQQCVYSRLGEYWEVEGSLMEKVREVLPREEDIVSDTVRLMEGMRDGGQMS